MSDDKSKSKSVSMPESLWEVIEAYVPTVNHDRSSWLRGLALKALGDANALPNDPVAQELARTKELIVTRGLEAVKAAHDEIANQSLAATGAET